MSLHLPDLSEFQGAVNWPAVVAHNGGAAIVRVCYGTGHVDFQWPHNRAAAETAGVKALGFYCYLVAGQDALAQAETFVRLVGSLKPGQFAVLDLEEGTGSQHARAQEWLGYVDRHLTYPGYHGAWLYSGESFAQEAGLAPIFASARHTWVAAYGTTEPSLPHSLWQHSNGTIARCGNEPWPGIGFCDCSQFNGSLGELLARISSHAPRPGPQPSPDPTPAPFPTEDPVIELDTTIASHPLLIDFGTKTMDLLSVNSAGAPLEVTVTFLNEGAKAKNYTLSWGTADTVGSGIEVPSGIKKARIDVVSGGGLPLGVRFNS